MSERIHLFSLCFAAVILTGLPPMIPSAAAEEICNTDSPSWTKVMDGEYHVSNNVWGSGVGVGEQCLDVDLQSTYFKVTKSTHNSAEVASYPYIRKGCHWGGCTDDPYNPFPIQLSELDSAPFSWIVGTEGVDGLWNAAFEAWISRRGKSAPNGGAELMIWINYYSGAGPAGSRVGTVEIGGHSWDVYFVDWNSSGLWNYIAYKIKVPADTVDLDLKDFIHDALTRGYLYTDWYLDAMEAGFEIWRDGEGLTCYDYYADAFDGGTLENYPPAPFALRLPSNKKGMSSYPILFKWAAAVDADRDPVEYLFQVTGPGVDTTVVGISADTLLFDGSSLLQPGTLYTWSVSATDGMDTTACLSSRTFRSPAASLIAESNSIPQRFSLSQNFPNPFNAQTEIIFEIFNPSFIDLSVFNVQGEKVRTLCHGYHATGQYRLNVDASSLSTGMYFYQLKTPDMCLRRKWLVMK